MSSYNFQVYNDSKFLEEQPVCGPDDLATPPCDFDTHDEDIIDLSSEEDDFDFDKVSM